MTTKATARVKLVIELDEPVALWLRDLMQYPIYEDETQEESNNRGRIYHALTTVNDRPVKFSPFVNNEDDIPW